MDLWPEKTVGFHAGDSLKTEGTLRTLEMALPDHGLSTSMTGEPHCYENARAERYIETGI
jgi:hypothetical protein